MMDIDLQAMRAKLTALALNPPTGKPWDKLTYEQCVRLDEINEDMGLLMAEWESICNDRFPIIHNMMPVDD